MTWPLAVIRPKIWLGSLLSTRLIVTLLALGWLNCTCALLPTLKVCQLMAALWLLCWMTMLAPLWLMLAGPAMTCPAVGNVATGGAVWAWVLRVNTPLNKAVIAAAT